MRSALALAIAFALPALAQQHQHGGDAKSDAGSTVPAHQKHPMDANAPEPRGQNITLKVGGESAKAYVAKPKGAPKGALLVFHEWCGLNDWVKHQADELAGLGYLALAIDLYKGKVATDPQTAQKLMGAKDEKWGDKVEEAGREGLRQNAGGQEGASIGWGEGGGGGAGG